jgi:hypothetical protein
VHDWHDRRPVVDEHVPSVWQHQADVMAHG